MLDHRNLQYTRDKLEHKLRKQKLFHYLFREICSSENGRITVARYRIGSNTCRYVRTSSIRGRRSRCFTATLNAGTPLSKLGNSCHGLLLSSESLERSCNLCWVEEITARLENGVIIQKVRTEDLGLIDMEIIFKKTSGLNKKALLYF